MVIWAVGSHGPDHDIAVKMIIVVRLAIAQAEKTGPLGSSCGGRHRDRGIKWVFDIVVVV